LVCQTPTILLLIDSTQDVEAYGKYLAAQIGSLGLDDRRSGAAPKAEDDDLLALMDKS
jgi:hypothetical protein